MTTIDEQREKMSSLIRPNRFNAKIFFPPFLDGTIATDLSTFMIEATVIPSSEMGIIEVPLAGGSKLKLAGDETFPDWSVTIKASADMPIYRAFTRWREFIKSPVAGTRANDLTYKSIVEIGLLDGVNEVVHLTELIGAFPVSVGELSLSREENDTYLRFDVTFAYDYMAQPF